MLILRYIQLQIMHYINNIALARTILHASVGQVQYGPSAGNIFWYPEYKAMQYDYVLFISGILCRHRKFISFTMAVVPFVVNWYCI